MKLIASLIASAAFLAFATPSYAQMTASTPAPKMMMKSSMKSSSMSSSMAMKCAPGTKMVKGYTKKDGTMVKAYCRKS